MRINEILSEATIDNIEIIQDLLNLVKRDIVKQLPKNQIYTFSKWDKKEIEKLKEKYNSEKIKVSLDGIKDVKIIFDNTEKSKNVLQSGFYNDSNKSVVINVSKIKSSSDLINLRKNNDTTKKIWQTVFHELRHYFQFVDYGEYITTLKGTDWSKRPTEWDALWSDLLYKHSPSMYDDSVEYAKLVVDELNNKIKSKKPYEPLSDKDYKNYLRKTAAYHQEKTKI